MRKFVKTVAVLALAVSVLSTSAFAALTGEVTGSNGTYTATVTPNTPGEQVTLLAVDTTAVDLTGAEPVLNNVTDTNIYYIDQNNTGSFENFQVKGESVAGKELFFFAGSASSNAAKYLGNDENLVVTIAAPNGTTIEVGGTVALTAAYEGGRPTTATWSAAKGGVDVTATALSATSVAGATFTGKEEGTYTVIATANGVASAPITITVNAPNYEVEPTTTLIKTAPGDDLGSEADAQNGLGVKIAIDSPKAFTKMIWVVVAKDGTRYYSESKAIEGATGAVTYYAAFGNGTAAANNIVDVEKVDAIFTVDETEATTFFTDYEADHDQMAEEE